jgi:amino acid adenylation domain-containing protein
MQTETHHGFRASPQQRRLAAWTAAGRATPRTAGWWTVHGPLDVATLRAALRQSIQRHEILRTRLTWTPGLSAPVQQVESSAPLILSLVDVTGMPGARARRECQWWFERTLSDDRSACTHLHAIVIRMRADRHALLLAMPATHNDRRGLESLATEVLRAHDGETLDEPTAQYADVAETLNAFLESDEFATGRARWAAEMPRLLRSRVPGWAAVAATGTFTPVLISADVPPDVSHALDADAAGASAAAEAADAVPAPVVDRRAVLLAVWQMTLDADAAPAETVGVSCDGRTHETLADLPGPFTRVVPIAMRRGGDDTPRRMILAAAAALDDADMRQEEFSWDGAGAFADGAVAWRDRPLGDTLPRDLSPDDRSEPAAFAAWGFDYHRASSASSRMELERLTSYSDRFVATLDCLDRPQGLHVDLHFDADVLPAAEARLLLTRMMQRLDAVIRHPDMPSHAAPLDPAERTVVIDAWNQTQRTWPDVPDVLAAIDRTAAAHADDVAVRWDGGTLTYASLAHRARTLARELIAAGVTPDARVGVLVDRSPCLVAALWATWAAGGAYVPLDLEEPPDRLAWIARDAGVTAIVAASPVTWWAGPLVMASLPEACAETRPEARPDRGEARPPLSPSQPSPRIHADALAYVLYTSGSTGRPKGVMVTRRALANHMAWLVDRFRLTSADRVLLKTSIGFDAAQWEVWAPLMCGGAIVLARPGGQRDPAYVAKWMGTAGVTVLQGVPSFLSRLVDEPALVDAAALRLVCSGGEVLTEALRQRWTRRSAAEFVNLYGPTETTIDATYWSNREHGGAVTLGRPVANLRAYVLDLAQRPVPIGVGGELYLGGAGLARGYIGRPDWTATRFVPDGISGASGARLYRTGDRVCWRATGMLEYLGRLDAQVKLRGYRIEPGEIEGVLSTHADVAQSAVVVADVSGEPQLVAFVRRRSGVVSGPARPTIAGDVRAWLQARLPWHLVPALVHEVDAFPVTSHGKIDRAALATWAPAIPRAADSAVPLATPSEELLASIWAALLGRAVDDRAAHFFHLGGHSLLATQVIARVQDVFGVEVPLRTIFEEPTLAGLAAAIDRGRQEVRRVPAIVAADRQQPFPLSYAQQRLWFLDQLEPGSPTYTCLGVLRLAGPLAIDALRDSIAAIVRRHEILRTTFPDRDGAPYQQIAAHATVDVPLIDLTSLPAGDRDRALRRVARAEAYVPFDLARGPLLRVRLLRTAPADHVLVIAMHHIVSDGWSVGLLVREFSALYAAATDGRPAALPALPCQYADYAVWQRTQLTDERLQRLLAYWRPHLDALEPLDLPPDRPRPARLSPRGATVSLTIDETLTAAVEALCHREGVTLFMVMLAAFGHVAARLTNRTRFGIGTLIANRQTPGTQDLVGFFVNQLVMRLDLDADPTIAAYLARIRATALAAYDHQELPFDRLVDAFGISREADRAPLLSTALVCQPRTRDAMRLPGLTIDAIDVGTVAAKYDFMLDVSSTTTGTLVATAEFKTDLFEPATVRRWIDRWVVVLEMMTADTRQRLTALDEACDAHERERAAAARRTYRDALRQRLKLSLAAAGD